MMTSPAIDQAAPLDGEDNLPERVDFMDVTFDALTPEEIFQRICGASQDAPFRFLVTPNVDHMVNIKRQPDALRPAYDAAWLTVCDSRILELLAKTAGLSIHAAPGSDLTERLFADGVISGDDAINIIGATPEVVDAVSRQYGVTRINHHEPPMGLRNKPEAIEECARFVAGNPARFTFICVGAPQQEMCAKAMHDRGDCVGVGLCVGASLDFLAGHQVRAPKWMQQTKLEWLYRLASNPSRMWKRYLVEGPKIFADYVRWRRHRD